MKWIKADRPPPDKTIVLVYHKPRTSLKMSVALYKDGSYFYHQERVGWRPLTSTVTHWASVNTPEEK